MRVHSFSESYRRGRIVEEALDERLRSCFVVEPVSRLQQRAGADRLLTEPASGRSFLAEYKADYRAAETGRAFVELFVAGKPGWARKLAGAVLLVYAVPPQGRALLIPTIRVQVRLPRWEAVHEQRQVYNATYSGVGLLLPLAELEAIASTELAFAPICADLSR